MNQTITGTLTRLVDGRAVPVPGRYTLDSGHTEVGFVARHLVVTKVRGRFERWEADIVVADRIEDSTVEVRIEAGSVTTNNPDRDTHLRGEDFFDADNHKHLVFRSTGVRPLGATRWAVDGTLEIRGVERPVTLELEFHGEQPDPWGNTRLVASAHTEINREDWGLTWNVAVESGGLLVSKKVQIEIEAQALPAA